MPNQCHRLTTILDLLCSKEPLKQIYLLLLSTSLPAFVKEPFSRIEGNHNDGGKGGKG